MEKEDAFPPLRGGKGGEGDEVAMLKMSDFDDKRYGDGAEGVSVNPVSCCLSILCPCAWLCSCFVLSESTEAVLLHFGKLSGVMKTPGCHCVNSCGRDLRSISLRKRVVELPASKVVDLNGSPLLVSAVITYKVVNSVRAALAVENVETFVKTSATAVMKKIVARFPYERRANDGSEHDLKTESKEISNEAMNLLQAQVEAAGCRVLSFQFCELSYSAEVAANFLRRQQAYAIIEARSTIVRGAVDIASHAVEELGRRGVNLKQAEKEKLLGDLISVICGENNGGGPGTGDH